MYQLLKIYHLMREQLILHSNENVDIVPSNISLAGINSKLESAMCRETVLKRFIDTVKDDYDYVIIDTNASTVLIYLLMLLLLQIKLL